jgi:hypothetical protein
MGGYFLGWVSKEAWEERRSDGLGKETRFAWQMWGRDSCIVIGSDQYITLMSNPLGFLTDYLIR